MISIHGYILILLAITSVISNGVGAKFNIQDINTKLRLLNRPAVKSIQSEDGDIIDCVDIYKQPAFSHPALKNHTIQMKPSYDSTEATTEKSNNSQIWTRSGSCPKGTIPIRRIREQDLLRAQSLDRFGRKNPTVVDHHRTKKYTNADHKDHGSIHNAFFTQVNHSTAVLVTEGFSYSGAKADLNVWNPGVEKDDEFSSGQIWLRNGPWYDSQSIETGWIVNPNVYDDRSTRLFVYWTSDSSKETGCFDLTCSGFVQTTDQIALGSVIDPVSYASPYGQYQITLYVYKDFDTNNWWLQYGNDVNIGYWPAELFSTLSHQAALVEWGGQVYSPTIGQPGPHTATAMGSGDTMAMYGYGCYIRQIRIRDNSLSLKYPEFVDTNLDEWNCYNAFLNWELAVDPEFYYGGPGRGDNCP